MTFLVPPGGTSDRAAAREELHVALPPGWWVDSPSYHDERREWVLYAFDPSERPVVGLRKREWQAVAPTEEGVVREMARCLCEIADGRWPKKTTTASVRRIRGSGKRSRRRRLVQV